MHRFWHASCFLKEDGEVGQTDLMSPRNSRRYKTMRKFLIVIGLIIALVAGWGRVSISANKGSVTLIKDYILSPFSKSLVNDDGQFPFLPLAYKTLASHENLANHNNFDWRYDMHFVTLYSGEVNSYLRFQVKEYQEFVSPDSRGFILWTFYDYDMDGELDSVDRKYYLIMQNRVFMMPDYPPGYINKDWYNVPKEEAEKRFQREVNYWLGLVKTKT
jgi:hypothetical protein